MIASVKDYARTRLGVLGYTEWSDGFNYKDIPKTKLDSVYHLELGESTGISNNQDHQVIESPVTVRLFKSPSRQPKTLIDQGISVADTVIADFIRASNRTTQSGIKNVTFVSMAIEPLEDSNDNGVTIKIAFKVLVYLTSY